MKAGENFEYRRKYKNAAKTSYTHGYSVRSIRAALQWIWCTKDIGSTAINIINQNIGTSKKIINKRVRVTPKFAEWSCTNKNNKLMRTLFFGWMVVHKERINERKKIIYVCRMVVCKWKKYINEDPNFWSNGRALKE